LLHGGLRKGNPDSQVMIGFYRSPGIAEVTTSTSDTPTILSCFVMEQRQKPTP